MNRTIVVRLTAAIVIGILTSSTWITSGKPDLVWLRYFSGAVFLSTFLLTVYDALLWRLPLLQRFPRVARSIRGTWKGTVSSMWVDPATGQTVAPAEAYLVVRQTSSTVTVRLITPESSSASTLARVGQSDGLVILDYVYLNRPRVPVRDRSPIHHGAVALEIFGTPAHRLAGTYWTDRDSKGELHFEARSSKIVDDFSDAAALFQEAP